jgi:hypothetical protein
MVKCGAYDNDKRLDRIPVGSSQSRKMAICVGFETQWHTI